MNPYPNKLYDKTPESRLYRHVLIRAAMDAAYGTAKIKLEVLEWVEDSNLTEDFDTVCHFAAADPDFSANSIFDILSSPRAAAIVLAESFKKAVLLKDGDDISHDRQRDHLSLRAQRDQSIP